MLVISAVLSLIIWAPAVYVARDDRRPLVTFVCWGLFWSVGPAFAGVLFPALLLHFVGLVVAILIVREGAVRPARYALPATLTATVFAYGIGSLFAFSQLGELTRLRERYPFVSLRERLPEARGADAREPLPAAADSRVTALEEQFRDSSDCSFYLQSLHRDTVQLFVSSPGFGVARTFRPSQSLLESLEKRVGPIPQPVPRASPSGPVPAPTPAAEADLYQLHQLSIVDFSNFQQWGYLRDRDHVAGFEPHRFSEVPGWNWYFFAVETVDLVSLLRHTKPAAYVSADLPRMDELRDAPVRSLDEFEAAGLEQLRHGDDLLVAESDKHLRMIGSIRSAKQCTTCHGCKRGDLLGAFSYSLRRKGT
jgi:hypothetical protein